MQIATATAFQRDEKQTQSSLVRSRGANEIAQCVYVCTQAIVTNPSTRPTAWGFRGARRGGSGDGCDGG